MMTVCVSADDDLIGGVLKINRAFSLMEKHENICFLVFFLHFFPSIKVFSEMNLLNVFVATPEQQIRFLVQEEERRGWM